MRKAELNVNYPGRARDMIDRHTLACTRAFRVDLLRLAVDVDIVCRGSVRDDVMPEARPDVTCTYSS